MKRYLLGILVVVMLFTGCAEMQILFRKSVPEKSAAETSAESEEEKAET